MKAKGNERGREGRSQMKPKWGEGREGREWKKRKVVVHVYLPTTSAISPAGRAPSKPPRANIDSDTFISNEVKLVRLNDSIITCSNGVSNTMCMYIDWFTKCEQVLTFCTCTCWKPGSTPVLYPNCVLEQGTAAVTKATNTHVSLEQGQHGVI